MIKFHASVPEALRHPTTWGSFAAILTPIATQVEGMFQHGLLIAAAACGFVGVMLKSPNTPDAPPAPPKDTTNG